MKDQIDRQHAEEPVGCDGFEHLVARQIDARKKTLQR
jgi:hypothetical protein